MKPHEVNDLNNFIAGFYMNETTICDEMIEYFKEVPNKKIGRTLGGVNKYFKDCLTSPLNVDLYMSYKDHLREVAKEYMKLYSFCKETYPWDVIEESIIQAYIPPSEGYPKWHCERCMPGKSANRYLTFMTYLNDVTIDGETEFYYQKIKIKPEKGLTLIWPVEWTHTHRGLPTPQEKYIYTGWFSFVGA